MGRVAPKLISSNGCGRDSIGRQIRDELAGERAECANLRNALAAMKADASAAALELDQLRSVEHKLREELEERCVLQKAGVQANLRSPCSQRPIGLLG